MRLVSVFTEEGGKNNALPARGQNVSAYLKENWILSKDFGLSPATLQAQSFCTIFSAENFICYAETSTRL
jgi:hypothetical protein